MTAAAGGSGLRSEGARVVLRQPLDLLLLRLALVSGDHQGVRVAHGHLGDKSRQPRHWPGADGRKARGRGDTGRCTGTGSEKRGLGKADATPLLKTAGLA